VTPQNEKETGAQPAGGILGARTGSRQLKAFTLLRAYKSRTAGAPPANLIPQRQANRKDVLRRMTDG
jgi:hypothetical protein